MAGPQCKTLACVSHQDHGPGLQPNPLSGPARAPWLGLLLGPATFRLVCFLCPSSLQVSLSHTHVPYPSELVFLPPPHPSLTPAHRYLQIIEKLCYKASGLSHSWKLCWWWHSRTLYKYLILTVAGSTVLWVTCLKEDRTWIQDNLGLP